MSQPLNFQSIIMALQDFWARQGCLIWQPYYTQVGAGTYNPATSLRVLGPEPWNVAYVEPSIRPDDGRYGENPNRMQMHYQFQVILKPDPGNPQEIYLKSLEALGIDPRQHDIRFVEDNWESPALGAWGLGWEVWLDGQEITQFTYFQQAGGLILDPVSVELTYGLERIAIALQRVSSFRDIQWSPTLTDGDVNLQAEQEHSLYYFEIADVGRLRQMYDLFEAEAEACLDRKLVLPAHDYVLKCSHTFNVLDTRGAIGVTERAAYFGRMRDLSRRVAEAYVEQRQKLEFPWLVEGSRLQVPAFSPGLPQARQVPDGSQAREGLTQVTSGPAQVLNLQLSNLKPSTFLLEIGTEELPAGDLGSALERLRQHVPALLGELRLEHGEVRILGTPRRLVVHVENLAPRQSDLEQVVKGPPADRAFDPAGAPTKAAEGFARSKGLAASDLQIREIDGGRYAVAVVRKEGLPAPVVLAEALPSVIAGLRFDKSMRWNSSNVTFSRPIRWLLALFGEQVIPFAYAGINSGDVTRGLRFNEPAEFSVKSTKDYLAALAAQGILLDMAERRQYIQSQIVSLAGEVGGELEADANLLDEVTNLVEAPTALRGSFDPSYLELPREVLISVMKKHQRYFPVFSKAVSSESVSSASVSREHLAPDTASPAALATSLAWDSNLADHSNLADRRLDRDLAAPDQTGAKSLARLPQAPVLPGNPGEKAGDRNPGERQGAWGTLLPYFIAVRNGDRYGLDRVVEGNEHVIRARFADAAYFIREDSKYRLEDFLPRLRTLTFQTRLGSMLDKTQRVRGLAEDLSLFVGLDVAEKGTTLRAAELCKADLVTQMVVEMTSLQGVMGRYYALNSGETADVAEAIYEHYLPRFPGDETPRSRPGLLVGLADRLDTLSGLFAAGMAPTSAKDPFAQRRAALGLVQNLIAWDLDFDLRRAIVLGAQRLPLPASAENQRACLDFIVERLRNLLLEQGWRHDVVDAVLAEQGYNPARASAAVRSLAAWVMRPNWNAILPAYARCVRITRDQVERYEVDPARFLEPAEGELFAALQTAEAACEGNQGSPDIFLNALLPMIPAINRYFDDVLVMADAATTRQNRLGLVQRIAVLAKGVADMSRLEGF